MKTRYFIKKLCVDERGATAVEYGLLLSLMVIGLLAALGSTGNSTQDKWNGVANQVTEATESVL